MPLIVVLDDVRSLHNVGSVFRTCDAFRVEAIYLCGITATPPSNEIHKTALGAEDSVEWKYFKTAEEAVDELHRNGYFVYSVEQAEGSMKLNQLEVGWLKEDGGSDASQEKSMKERSTSYINHLPSEASLQPSPSNHPTSSPSSSPIGETLQPSSFNLPTSSPSSSPIGETLQPSSFNLPTSSPSSSPIGETLQPSSFNLPTSSPSSSPIGETLQPSSFNHPTSKYAVIFGNEVKGVHQSVIDMSDGCLEIPQFGTKHSMNVSVTAGIVIWEFAKQFI